MAITELSLLLDFLQAVSSLPPPHASSPQQPATIQAPRSIAEVGEVVLRCYHPSGRFTDVNLIQRPWVRASDYKASDSAVISIDWRGAVLQSHFRLVVALVARDNQLKGVILADNDPIPPSPKCPLNGWVQVETTAAKN